MRLKPLSNKDGKFHVPELFVVTTLVEKVEGDYERITDLSIEPFKHDEHWKKKEES